MDFMKKIFPPKEKTEPEKLTWQQALFLNLKDILYILAGFLLVYTLFFRMVVVDGTSMNQTLLDGDRLLLVSSTVYPNPKQGDIVVFSRDSFRDGECVVKRVIATEGQKVDIDFKNRVVYVDDQPLEESYVYFSANDNGPMKHDLGMDFPLIVEKGCVFVMGDNRNNSLDSRYTEIGLVDCREILGKAIFLMLPGSNDGEGQPDYSRIGFISR